MRILKVMRRMSLKPILKTKAVMSLLVFYIITKGTAEHKIKYKVDSGLTMCPAVPGDGNAQTLCSHLKSWCVIMPSSLTGSFLFSLSIGPRTTSLMPQWKRSWLENSWSIPSETGRKSTSSDEIQRLVRSAAPSSTGYIRKQVAVSWSQTCRVSETDGAALQGLWACAVPKVRRKEGGGSEEKEKSVGYQQASPSQDVTHVPLQTKHGEVALSPKDWPLENEGSRDGILEATTRV